MEHHAGYEEWRAIPGFDFYEASSLGRVRSWYARRGRWHPGSRADAPRILRPGVDREGRRHLVLRQDGRDRTRRVHQLVAAAFLGPAPWGAPLIRHDNGNPADNRPHNLVYATQIENMGDTGRHGTLQYGEHCSTAKLSKETAAAILMEPGTHRAIAAKYGITHNHVGKLKRGEVRSLELAGLPVVRNTHGNVKP
jgi:hypothetical protein